MRPSSSVLEFNCPGVRILLLTELCLSVCLTAALEATGRRPHPGALSPQTSDFAERPGRRSRDSAPLAAQRVTAFVQATRPSTAGGLRQAPETSLWAWGDPGSVQDSLRKFTRPQWPGRMAGAAGSERPKPETRPPGAVRAEGSPATAASLPFLPPPVVPLRRSTRPRGLPWSPGAVSTVLCLGLPARGQPDPSLPSQEPPEALAVGQEGPQQGAGSPSHLSTGPAGRSARTPGQLAARWKEGTGVRGGCFPPALQTEGAVCWSLRGFRSPGHYLARFQDGPFPPSAPLSSGTLTQGQFL